MSIECSNSSITISKCRRWQPWLPAKPTVAPICFIINNSFTINSRISLVYNNSSSSSSKCRWQRLQHSRHPRIRMWPAPASSFRKVRICEIAIHFVNIFLISNMSLTIYSASHMIDDFEFKFLQACMKQYTNYIYHYFNVCISKTIESAGGGHQTVNNKTAASGTHHGAHQHQ